MAPANDGARTRPRTESRQVTPAAIAMRRGWSGDRVTPPWYVRRMTDLPAAEAVPEGPVVGRVLGSVEATPMVFHVGLAPGSTLQLDDVVVTEREVPGHRHGHRCRAWSSQVRAVHEGAQFGSDVFLIADGVLPAETFEAAEVMTTRVEPETYVPPLPGAPGAAGRGCRAGHGAVLRPHGAAAADRARARRRAALPQPRVPRRATGRPRQHLGHLGRGHEDHATPPSCSTACSRRGCSAPRRPTPRPWSST